jgi:mono/diheme cytochrome c family protein
MRERMLTLTACAAAYLFTSGTGGAQAPTPCIPEVAFPYAGDPRLEPLPPHPVHVGDFEVWGSGHRLRMRFPPRVNGQSHSDGDGHAAIYLFVDEATGLPVAGQLPVLDAVPKGAAPNVPDLWARRYSAIWELSVVLTAPEYDPADPGVRIDAFEEIFSSPHVRRICTTNVYLNCPVLPQGSTVDPGSPPLEHAWWRGHEILLAPYDVEDGISHPQILFKFEDSGGATLPSAANPHLVASRIPGEPFYSSIWEVWTVRVPDGYPVTTLRSKDAILAAGLPIASANIRLNCPVVAVESAPDSGVMEPMSFVAAFDLLRNDFSAGVGRFHSDTFRVDAPQGQTIEFVRDALGEPIGRALAPSPRSHSRTFLVTGVDFFPAPFFEPLWGLGLQFPQVALGGNCVPLIQQKPFSITPAAEWPASSSPDSTGALIRFTQRDLDDAYRNSFPPRLPEPIEQNIAAFIQNGLMDPMWAPGVTPYVERLALVGQALHEVDWQPEQGVNVLDTVSCVSCHSMPAPGGASRGLYTMAIRDPKTGEVTDTQSAGSMWGSGSSELLAQELKAAGHAVTHAHGSTGERDTIRRFVAKASAVHMGVQSVESIMATEGVSHAIAATMDADGDGVALEMTAGEVTAQAAFLLHLPPPAQADIWAMRAMGLSLDDVYQGRRLFRQTMAQGGIGCAGCHTPFQKVQQNTVLLGNPETGSRLFVPVMSHLAEADDVAEGYADHFGQQGLRVYGDLKLHRMGPDMRSSGGAAPLLLKTAELWDVGSTYPLRRGGDAGSDLRAVILAHEGRTEPVAIQATLVGRGQDSRRAYTVRITNTGSAPLFASPKAPLRLVLAGPMSPASAVGEGTDGLAPDGTGREGAWWAVDETILPGRSIKKTISFWTERRLPLSFQLALATDDGWSEAVASARAFRLLPAAQQAKVIAFLRAQLIANTPGE